MSDKKNSSKLDSLIGPKNPNHGAPYEDLLCFRCMRDVFGELSRILVANNHGSALVHLTEKNNLPDQGPLFKWFRDYANPKKNPRIRDNMNRYLNSNPAVTYDLVSVVIREHFRDDAAPIPPANSPAFNSARQTVICYLVRDYARNFGSMFSYLEEVWAQESHLIISSLLKTFYPLIVECFPLRVPPIQANADDADPNVPPQEIWLYNGTQLSWYLYQLILQKHAPNPDAAGYPDGGPVDPREMMGVQIPVDDPREMMGMQIPVDDPREMMGMQIPVDDPREMMGMQIPVDDPREMMRVQIPVDDPREMMVVQTDITPDVLGSPMYTMRMESPWEPQLSDELPVGVMEGIIDAEYQLPHHSSEIPEPNPDIQFFLMRK